MLKPRVVVEGGEVPGVTSLDELDTMIEETMPDVRALVPGAYDDVVKMINHSLTTRAGCPESVKALERRLSNLVVSQPDINNEAMRGPRAMHPRSGSPYTCG